MSVLIKYIAQVLVVQNVDEQLSDLLVLENGVPLHISFISKLLAEILSRFMV